MNAKRIAKIAGDVLGSAILPKDLFDYVALALALGGVATGTPELAKAGAAAYALYTPARSAMYLTRKYFPANYLY
ncbi:hypothetical protein D4Q76_02335 [archaeon]|nr:MAG: hypothetical protein D4Q76_02335 [archaeon]